MTAVMCNLTPLNLRRWCDAGPLRGEFPTFGSADQFDWYVSWSTRVRASVLIQPFIIRIERTSHLAWYCDRPHSSSHNTSCNTSMKQAIVTYSCCGCTLTFVCFQVSRNKEITMCTLGVFSWSLLQFSLVTTSFGRKKQDEKISEKVKGKTCSLTSVCELFVMNQLDVDV